MTCEAPVRECLARHVAGHLANAKIYDNGLKIRARCPNCEGHRSLVISAGEHDRIVWHCHTGCDGKTVRAALIAAGVPTGCLPRGDGTEITPLDRIMAVIAERDPNRAATIFRIAAIGRGYTKWPEGEDLEQIARESGISRASAFAARRVGPLGSSPPELQYHHT